jgi:hypothetical protein
MTEMKSSHITKSALACIATVTLSVSPVFAATHQSNHTTITSSFISHTAPQNLPYPLQTEVGMGYSSHSHISPLTTVTGPGGIARLNVLETYRELAWNVQPAGMLTNWTFDGTISYEVLDPDTHEYVPDGSVVVSGIGVPGGSAGGNVGIGGFPTGLSYTATLNGTATDALGDNDTVLPGCSVAWYFTN